MPVTLQKGRALDHLNLTPLIDVIFLLLIFFLVATRFSQDDRELPVRLPSASNALPMTLEPNELIVSLDAAGGVYLQGNKVDLADVESEIARRIAENPVRQSVVIRSDRMTPVQWVVQIVDLCTKYKVPSYRLSTAPESEP